MTKDSLKIIPLGGLEQIGMNITAFEYGETIIVVDCGLAFPDDEMLGIDLVIPNVSYLKDNIERVKAFFITHGHEDHIGALPYVLKEVNVPVYSTKLTLGIIKHKLEEHQMLDYVDMRTVTFGDTVDMGKIKVEFIRTNHSIADAAALAITSPAGTIVHTGDFKVDYTPVYGDAIDLQRFAELGSQGVLALMADSTNAEKPGMTMSEKTVGKTLDHIFSEEVDNRIIIATFASNVDRVQQIINTAHKYGRKVCVEGRSMNTYISTAVELGYIKLPDNILIEIEDTVHFPPNRLVIITTGSQGESMAALSRMANSTHRKVSIGPSDTIIFSSHPIPGNEKNVSKVINELMIKGAKVIFQDTHVSGHACADDLKLIYTLVKPKYAIPVHGEYRQRSAQKEIAKSLGIPSEDILLINSGDVLEISPEKAGVIGRVASRPVMVDGLGVGDIGNAVLRDRQYLSENGLVVISMAVYLEEGIVVNGPEIVSKGFVYVKESETLIEEAKFVAAQTFEYCVHKNYSDIGRIRNEIKSALSDFFWKNIKRRPMILPIIMKV
ncbi:MAG: ribonuclease J [Lachnospiraceae bacterium]|nr:ribonuclease J [Lachnospiraceae bacterium]